MEVWGWRCVEVEVCGGGNVWGWRREGEEEEEACSLLPLPSSDTVASNLEIFRVLGTRLVIQLSV